MRIAFALLATAVIAQPVAAQSLYNAAGLGTPVESLDGRARALGNLGIGLWGAGLTPSDPAASAMIRVPTGVLVGQPSWVDFDRGAGDTGSFEGNRFPLMGIAYPAFGGTVNFTLGALLDQRFQGSREITYDLLDGAANATDDFQQDGAVSDVRIGYARLFGGWLGAGLTVGRYAGSVTRTLVRDFEDLGAVEILDDFEVTGRWRYSGLSVTGGLTADFADVLRVASSVTYSGTLDATGVDGSDGIDRAFNLPMQLRLGASAVLSEGLMLTGSILQADWVDIGDDVGGTGAIGGTSGYGFGLELSRARLLGMTAPLRFGYRSTDLPFAYGAESASETAWAGGLALALSEANGIVFASADLSLERGTRSDLRLSESFWRGTISLKISGF